MVHTCSLHHIAGDEHIQAALMEWYDVHARVLPWRVGPEALARGGLDLFCLETFYDLAEIEAAVEEKTRRPRLGRSLVAGLLAGLAPQVLAHGGTYREQRFSRLDQINDGNVSRLGLAWYFDFDTHRGQESTPLMVDGTLYVTDMYHGIIQEGEWAQQDRTCYQDNQGDPGKGTEQYFFQLSSNSRISFLARITSSRFTYSSTSPNL